MDYHFTLVSNEKAGLKPSIAFSVSTAIWREPSSVIVPMKSKGTIAVDFDRTLAFRVDGMETLGKPIGRTLRRVKQYLKDGHDVEIFTARATSHKEISRVQDWLEKHGLPRLPVTNIKKPYFTRIEDDLAVGVKPNHGELVTAPQARRRIRLSR